MSTALHVICPHCDALNRVPQARLADQPICGGCRQALFAGQPRALDDAGFRRHIQRSDLPLLVDFWASWCGPCRTMAPEFAAAAKQLEPTMQLGKLSTEDAPRVASEYQISSIPTLALFLGGREVARQAGAMPASRIIAWARAALAKAA